MRAFWRPGVGRGRRRRPRCSTPGSTPATLTLDRAAGDRVPARRCRTSGTRSTCSCGSARSAARASRSATRCSARAALTAGQDAVRARDHGRRDGGCRDRAPDAAHRRAARRVGAVPRRAGRLRAPALSEPVRPASGRRRRHPHHDLLRDAGDQHRRRASRCARSRGRARRARSGTPARTASTRRRARGGATTSRGRGSRPSGPASPTPTPCARRIDSWIVMSLR